MSNEYSPYYEGGWQSGESGGTPITPEALNHWDTALEQIDLRLSETNERLDTHAKSTENPHSVTKEQVGLGNVPDVATNDQTPTYTKASNLADLSSGEKLSVAFGKIAKAVADLISHIGNKSNPHGVTVSQIGAATSGHTHNYAGSSSAGGAAASANKLNTNAGSAGNPVYFSNGVPVACTPLKDNVIKYQNNKATITTSTSFGATGVTLTVPAGSYYICSGSCQYNKSNPTRITIIGNGNSYAGNVSNATNGSLSCCYANYASSDMVLELHAQYAGATSNVVELKMVYFKP